MNEYKIAVANSRTAKFWTNEEVSWGELKKRLTSYVFTPETAEEYKLLTNKQRGDTKDVGGFVGGHLGGNGERKKENVICRSLITIDIDKAHEMPCLDGLKDYRYIIYSTHSYTESAPCVRIVLPLSRDVEPLEYRAICHYLCGVVGLDGIDISCCEPERLMFYPSVPRDVVPFTSVNEGDCVDADWILSQYNNWKNPAEWAGASDGELRRYAVPLVTVTRSDVAGTSDQSNTNRIRTIDVGESRLAVEDPTTKAGVVGAWCRAVSIYEALAICSHVYEPTNNRDRYTFRGAESDAGVVVYDGKWIYSNHSNKDPNAGKLLNSFDLVRLILFGSQDASSRVQIESNKPSYIAMCQYAMDNPVVRGAMTQMEYEEANRAYGYEVVYNGDQQEEPTEDNKSPAEWMSELDTLRDVKSGELKPSVLAFSLILKNDIRLIKGNVMYDEFSDMITVVGNIVWRATDDHQWTDVDMACLELEVQKLWGLENKGRLLRTAFFSTFGDKAFRYNPVTDYIQSQKWDGVPRVEELFIKYLGVPDEKLYREISRKALVACVARVFDPGCKFDQVTILSGSQGAGKSTLLYKLAGDGEWFNESMDLSAQNNKLEEAVVGSWIIELAEMQGHNKKDVESMKSFISKRQDKFRGAYKEFTVVHKRSCVFFGTTNEREILRDLTGNRRYWILPCDKTKAVEDVWSLSQDEVMQVWAEAYVLWRMGEKLMLDDDMSATLVTQQKEFDANQAELAELEEWLDTPLPAKANWEKLTKEERRLYFTAPRMLDLIALGDPVAPRDCVSPLEVYNEFYGDTNIKFKTAQCKTIALMLDQLAGWKRDPVRKRISGYGRQICYNRVKGDFIKSMWAGSVVGYEDGKIWTQGAFEL